MRTYIRQKRDDNGVKKTFTAFVRRADEGTLSRLLVESSILMAASCGNPTVILKEAATTCKVDTDAITTKVRQKFASIEGEEGGAYRASNPEFEKLLLNIWVVGFDRGG